MENQILEPLKYYQQTAKVQHENNIDEYFNKLVNESKINAEENRQTAKLFRKQDKIASQTKSKISRLKVWRVLLIILSVISVITCFGTFVSEPTDLKVVVRILSLFVFIGSLLLIFLLINKKLKHSEELYQKQRETADKTYQLALSQMTPLNQRFTENDTFDLIEKIIPRLKFNRDYNLDLDEDFRKNFSFESENLDTRSVVNTVSGRYNENPFMFCRHLNHYMSTKTYTGTKLITYQVHYRDSDGKMRTATRTQTLVATVTKPYPMYAYATALNYGHQTAPDLSFTRTYKHVEDWSESKVDRHVRKGEKKLRKKAQKAVESGEQFTEMTNSEFDVLFGATDRNHEVQFRVMFSPAAQLNMVRLIRASEEYGDDFSFVKHGKHNYIVSEHAQTWDMDTSPNKYWSYDIDIAHKNFKDFNNQYFRSLYFDFAPLLSIPTYHEKPSATFEKYDKLTQNYTDYEYEVMANSIGYRNFEHADSKTQCILKADHLYSTNTTDCVQISAYSYTSLPRIDIVPVLGRDGRMHGVPVPWEEFLPVKNVSKMAIKRVSMTVGQFESKKPSLDSGLFNSPNAYYHGLFAKILTNNEVDLIDKKL